MVHYIKFVINVLLILVALGLFAYNATAQDRPAPTTPYFWPYDGTPLADDLKKTPVVVELFTSLDCLFCPRTEKLLKDLVTKGNVIALACHTDPEGEAYPLSRDFCSTRQERYAEKLADGLLYTPQMVINGHIDAVGYDFEDVKLGLEQGLTDKVHIWPLRPTDQAGILALDLPKTDLGKGRSADITLMTWRKPYRVPKSQRQSLTRPDPLLYVANRMVPVASWSGAQKTLTIPVGLQEDEEGFLILIQRDDGPIIGVARP